MPDRRQNNDHDLLIELRTEMQGVRSDIKDLKDGTAARLTVLESDRVIQKDHKDHEDRIRRLELWGSMAIGALYILNFLIGVYLALKH